jgi:RluA family pseudouridine synthase
MITSEEFKFAFRSIPPILSEKSKSPRTFILSIKKKFHNCSLLEVYAKSFPHVESDFWKEKIKSGNLTLDHQKSLPNTQVKAGQITQHTVAGKPEPKVNWDIELIHANPNFWVLNKPAPLPVHSGGRYLFNTLTDGLKAAFPELKFHLINRLDANTTGIVLVALNKEYAHLLSKQFENRTVQKTYLALVEGIPTSKKFKSTASISKTKTPAGGRELVQGSNSKTDFKLIKSFTDTSLLEVQPHSGHTNQIRLHLAGLHHPILGDVGYKNPTYFKTNPLTYPSDSLFLHAWKLCITHPETEEKKEFTAKPKTKWLPYL